MSGTNGYVTPGQLKALRRLERDFTEWPEGKMRVQALLTSEIARVVEYATGPDGKYDYNADRQAQIAFGLVQPDLGANDDLDAAIEIVNNIPVGVQEALRDLIVDLTRRKPSEAYRDFDSAGDSAAAGAGTPASTSSSASS